MKMKRSLTFLKASLTSSVLTYFKGCVIMVIISSLNMCNGVAYLSRRTEDDPLPHHLPREIG